MARIDTQSIACDDAQARMVDMTYGELQPSSADAVVRHRQACPECERFAHDLGLLRHELGEYRTSVLESIEPSPQHLAALKRSLVALVRDEVTAAHRERSLRARAWRGIQRFARAWRDLQQSSRTFQVATHGAVALGVGLFFAMIIDVSGSSNSLAAEAEQLAPASSDSIVRDRPDVMKTSLDVERRAGELPQVHHNERLPRKQKR